jgi:hypothetical protein
MARCAVSAGLIAAALAITACSSPNATESPEADRETPDSASTSSVESASETMTPCTEREVESLVEGFIRAFNAGDSGRLERIFAREPEFEWYSTDKPGARFNEAAYDRSTLIPYFARRHARGERLELSSFQFGGNAQVGGTRPYGNFQYQLVRRADDLPPTPYIGKGATRCYDDEPDVIFVWSMGGA